MRRVKFFKYGPVNLESKIEHSEVFNTTINTFTLNEEIEANNKQEDFKLLRVSGPYVSYIPPSEKHPFERVIYTANVLYEITPISKQ